MFPRDEFVPKILKDMENIEENPQKLKPPYCEPSTSKAHKNAPLDFNFEPTVDYTKSSTLEEDVFECNEIQTEQKSSCKAFLNYFKVTFLCFIWLGCCIILMNKSVSVKEVHQLSIARNDIKEYLIFDTPKKNILSLKIQGAMLPEYYANLSKNTMEIWIQMIRLSTVPHNVTFLDKRTLISAQNVSEKVWKLPLVSDELIGVVPEIKQDKIIHLKPFNCVSEKQCFLQVNLKTNLNRNFPISLSYHLNPINTNIGVVYAAIVLIFLYVLIAFEIIHKTLAAMISSTMSIAILAMLDARPTLAEIISWIDTETLLLLFSMMVLVAIISETGIFDYLAVNAFMMAGGKIWPLINTLCFTTAVLSCFLDNVTTALLMTPITIKLCEVMKLNPVPVLTNMVIYSNIGGAITPIGDPPNIIVASNALVIDAGVDFGTFTLHMSIGVFLALIVANIQLRILYRNPDDFRNSEPEDLQEIRREIEVWKRTAASMSSYSKEEHAVKDSMIKRTSRLGKKLHSRAAHKCSSPIASNMNLSNLAAQFPIRDVPLLIKSGITMTLVIVVFFLHSLPQFSRLGLGWTALLGSLLLLIMANRDNLDPIFAKVEWGTLLFFASLFILMEALSRLGLIDWIGSQTQYFIMSIDEKSRLASAILIILWVSAFASALVDNIPLTTMMIRIATSLAQNRELGLPLQPLVWALSFGACFGGNGTLFGSSSNIVCAGVSEQHGYRFSFLGFMKIGFPIMISTISTVTIYLLVAHVVFTWH